MRQAVGLCKPLWTISDQTGCKLEPVYEIVLLFRKNSPTLPDLFWFAKVLKSTKALNLQNHWQHLFGDVLISLLHSSSNLAIAHSDRGSYYTLSMWNLEAYPNCFFIIITWIHLNADPKASCKLSCLNTWFECLNSVFFKEQNMEW